MMPWPASLNDMEMGGLDLVFHGNCGSLWVLFKIAFCLLEQIFSQAHKCFICNQIQRLLWNSWFSCEYRLHANHLWPIKTRTLCFVEGLTVTVLILSTKAFWFCNSSSVYKLEAPSQHIRKLLTLLMLCCEYRPLLEAKVLFIGNWTCLGLFGDVSPLIRKASPVRSERLLQLFGQNWRSLSDERRDVCEKSICHQIALNDWESPQTVAVRGQCHMVSPFYCVFLY